MPLINYTKKKIIKGKLKKTLSMKLITHSQPSSYLVHLACSCQFTKWTINLSF